MSNAARVQVHTANPASGPPAPILVDAGVAPFTAPLVKVLTVVPLQPLYPPGWPTPPDEVGAATAARSPVTVPAGTTLNCFACVAAALIAAGAAVMKNYPLPVELYIANPGGSPTPVSVAALSPPFSSAPVKVKLTAPVQQLCPPGWPPPPYQAGAASIGWTQQTIASGATISAFACVAAALIAAGFATAD